MDGGPAGRLGRLGGDQLQAGRRDAFDAAVVGAGLDRPFDVGVDELLEVREQVVLLVDLECQQAVEEGVHGRQIGQELALAVGDRQPGLLLERVGRPAVDAAGVEIPVEGAQGRLGVLGLEVVGFTEELRVVVAHPALRVLLPARDRPEAVDAPRDGGGEPPLSLHVGGDRGEQRRALLARAVRAAEALDGLVRLPAGLEQVVAAALRVGARQVGVVGAARVAGAREDERALLPVHERLGLVEVRAGGPVADGEPVAAAVVGDA